LYFDKGTLPYFDKGTLPSLRVTVLIIHQAMLLRALVSSHAA